MSRELDFFRIPKRVLIAEEAAEWRDMLVSNIPHLQGLPDGVDRGSLLDVMLADDRVRLRAEQSLRLRYRFPEDIPDEHVATPEEKSQIDKVIAQAEEFSRQKTEGILVQPLFGGGFVQPNFINLIRQNMSVHEAKWHRFVLASYLRPDPKILPFNTVLGFRAFLDAEEHFDEYNGTGPDEFWLNRDDEGTIQTYRVTYKGAHNPTTPWSHMHRDDMPIIHAFTQRIREDIDLVGSGVEVRVGNE